LFFCQLLLAGCSYVSSFCQFPFCELFLSTPSFCRLIHLSNLSSIGSLFCRFFCHILLLSNLSSVGSFFFSSFFCGRHFLTNLFCQYLRLLMVFLLSASSFIKSFICQLLSTVSSVNSFFSQPHIPSAIYSLNSCLSLLSNTLSEIWIINS